jgi:hypothetical protein
MDQDVYLYKLNFDINYLTKEIKRDAEWLKDLGEQIKRKLENFNLEKDDWSGLNSLGELQGNGVSLDLKIAKLATLIEQRKLYLNIKTVQKEVK